MVRVAAAALALVVWVGVADAGPTRKVRVETNPSGAVVYIEAKENGAACEPTPCSVDLPYGESSLIIEAANFDTKFVTVTVPKKGKVKLDTVALTPAVGVYVIKGPAGASISIDGKDEGKAPARIEVSAETHKIIVTKDGKTIFDQYVDAPSGDETEVPILALKGGSASDVEEPSEGTEGGTTEGGTIEGGVSKNAPTTARGPIVAVSAAMNVGFRTFTYENNQTRDSLRDESESGQVILGPLVEVWPGQLLGMLRGLSLVGRFQFRINEQPVTGGGIQGSLSTFWQSLEVSGRYKFVFADSYGIEVGAGWARDVYRFNGTPQDKELVPDAQYDGLRLGGRFSMLTSTGSIGLEPYVDIEARIVTNGGPLQQRFGASTSVNGVRAAIGTFARFGGFYVRPEAAIQRYAWTFESTADLMASGGTDVITLIGFYAGYAY